MAEPLTSDCKLHAQPDDELLGCILASYSDQGIQRSGHLHQRRVTGTRPAGIKPAGGTTTPMRIAPGCGSPNWRSRASSSATWRTLGYHESVMRYWDSKAPVRLHERCRLDVPGIASVITILTAAVLVTYDDVLARTRHPDHGAPSRAARSPCPATGTREGCTWPHEGSNGPRSEDLGPFRRRRGWCLLAATTPPVRPKTLAQRALESESRNPRSVYLRPASSVKRAALFAHAARSNDRGSQDPPMCA